MPVNLKGIYIYVLSPSSLDLPRPSSLIIYGKTPTSCNPVPPLFDGNVGRPPPAAAVRRAAAGRGRGAGRASRRRRRVLLGGPRGRRRLRRLPLRNTLLQL